MDQSVVQVLYFMGGFLKIFFTQGPVVADVRHLDENWTRYSPLQSAVNRNQRISGARLTSHAVSGGVSMLYKSGIHLCYQCHTESVSGLQTDSS